MSIQSIPAVQAAENQVQANVVQSAINEVKDAGKTVIDKVTAPKTPPPKKAEAPPITQPTDPELPDHLLEFDPKDTHVPIGGERWRPNATLELPPEKPKPAVENSDLEQLLDAAAARQAATHAGK